MKGLLVICFVFAIGMGYAQQPDSVKTVLVKPLIADTAQPSLLRKQIVPRYQIPKGNVFCRMEDLVTRKTGVWLKVGVTDKIK